MSNTAERTLSRAEEFVREIPEFITVEQLAEHSGIEIRELEAMIDKQYLCPLVSDINPDIRLFHKDEILASIDGIKDLWDDYKATLELPQYKIKFVDSVTKQVIKELDTDVLHTLREDDFPMPLPHDGKKFTGWSQGKDKEGNTLFSAQYANLTKEETEAGVTDPLFGDEEGELFDNDEELALDTEGAPTEKEPPEPTPDGEFEKFDFEASYQEILEKQQANAERNARRAATLLARRKYAKHQEKLRLRHEAQSLEDFAICLAAVERARAEDLARHEAQRELYARKQREANTAYEEQARAFFAERMAKEKATAERIARRREELRREERNKQFAFASYKPFEASQYQLSDAELDSVRQAMSNAHAPANEKDRTIAQVDAAIATARQNNTPITAGQLEDIIKSVYTDEAERIRRDETTVRTLIENTIKEYNEKYTAERQAESDRAQYGVDTFRVRDGYMTDQRIVTNSELATLQGQLNGLPDTPETHYIREQLSTAVNSGDTYTVAQVQSFVDTAYEAERTRLEAYQQTLTDNQGYTYKAVADAIDNQHQPATEDPHAPSMATVLQNAADANALRNEEYRAEAMRHVFGVDELRRIQDAVATTPPTPTTQQIQSNIRALADEATQTEAATVTLYQVAEIIHQAYDTEHKQVANALETVTQRIENAKSEVTACLTSTPEWVSTSEQYARNEGEFCKHIREIAEQYQPTDAPNADTCKRLSGLATYAEREIATGAFTPASYEIAKVVYEQVEQIYREASPAVRATMAPVFDELTSRHNAMHETVANRYTAEAISVATAQADTIRTQYREAIANGVYELPPKIATQTAVPAPHDTISVEHLRVLRDTLASAPDTPMRREAIQRIDSAIQVGNGMPVQRLTSLATHGAEGINSVSTPPVIDIPLAQTVRNVLTNNPEYAKAVAIDRADNSAQYRAGARAYSEQLHSLAETYKNTPNYDATRYTTMATMAAVVKQAGASYSPESVAAISKASTEIARVYDTMPPKVKAVLSDTVQEARATASLTSGIAVRDFTRQMLQQAQQRVDVAYTRCTEQFAPQPKVPNTATQQPHSPTHTDAKGHVDSRGSTPNDRAFQAHKLDATQRGHDAPKGDTVQPAKQNNGATDTPVLSNEHRNASSHTPAVPNGRTPTATEQDANANAKQPDARTEKHGVTQRDDKRTPASPTIKSGDSKQTDGHKPQSEQTTKREQTATGAPKQVGDKGTTQAGDKQSGGASRATGTRDTKEQSAKQTPADKTGSLHGAPQKPHTAKNEHNPAASIATGVAAGIAGAKGVKEVQAQQQPHGVRQIRGKINSVLQRQNKDGGIHQSTVRPVGSASTMPKPASEARAVKNATTQKRLVHRNTTQKANTKLPKRAPKPKVVLNPRNISSKRPVHPRLKSVRITMRQRRMVQLALQGAQKQPFFSREWKQNTRTALTQMRRMTVGKAWSTAKNALRRAFYSGTLGKTPPMKGAMILMRYAQWTMPIVNSLRISAAKMGAEKLARKLEARLAKDGTNLKTLLAGAGLTGDFSKLNLMKRKELQGVMRQLRGEMRNNDAFRATFINKGNGALKRVSKNPMKTKKGIKGFKFNAKEVSAAKAMLTLTRMQKAQAKIRRARMKSRFNKIGLVRHVVAGTAAAQGWQIISRNARYARTAMRAIRASLKATKLVGKLAFMPLRVFRNTNIGRKITATKNKVSDKLLKLHPSNIKKNARKRAAEATKKGAKRAMSAISKRLDRSPAGKAVKKVAQRVRDKAKKATKKVTAVATKIMKPFKAIAHATRAVKAFLAKVLLVVGLVALGLVVASYIANSGGAAINVMFGWLLGPDNTGQEDIPIENTVYYEMWNQLAAKEENWLRSIDGLKTATPSGDEATGFYDPRTGQPYVLQEWGYTLFDSEGNPLLDEEGEAVSSAGVIVKYENGEGQQIPYRMNARDILAMTSARFQGDFAAQVNWMHDYAWRGDPQKFLFFTVSHNKANLWEVSHSTMDEIQRIVGPRNADGTLAPPIICPGCDHYTYHCNNADEIARVAELYNSSVRTDESGNTVSAIVEIGFEVPTVHEHGCSALCQPKQQYRCAYPASCPHKQTVTFVVGDATYSTEICPGHIGVYDETGAFEECYDIVWTETTEPLEVQYFDTTANEFVTVTAPVTYNKPVCNGHCNGHDVHFCHGHRTLTLVAKILTIDECVENEHTGMFSGTSFFDADPHCEPRHSEEYPSAVEQPDDPASQHAPNETPNPDADGQAWAITYWDRDHIALAMEFFRQDWYANYGVQIASVFGGSYSTGETMSSAEIAELLQGIHTTDFRTRIITYALNSVGRIPYFYGGKAVKAGYIDRPIYISGQRYEIGEPTHVADKNGRTLAGLDCSGWTCWVYNTVIEEAGIPTSSVLVAGVSQNLGNMGTAGLKDIGVGISPSELQPGDLCVVRSGSSNHVGIFLTWIDKDAGRMLCVHEGPPNVNVKEFSTSAWNYYRRVINQQNSNP